MDIAASKRFFPEILKDRGQHRGGAYWFLISWCSCAATPRPPQHGLSTPLKRDRSLRKPRHF